MRLFFACNLPPAERTRLWRAAEALREADLPVRWAAEESLHVTVKFLGEVPEAKLAALESALREAAQKSAPFEMRLRGLGGFPNLKRPRVVWVGADANDTLARLQADTERLVVPLGFEPEDRDFHPHVTLGRAAGGTTTAQFGALQELAREFDYDVRVRVKTLDLMRSHTARGGARYERLLAVELAG